MSRVIKGNSPVELRPIGRVAALNIANFSEQAQKLIIEAQAKAAQTIAQAGAKAKEIEKQAEQRGYNEGLQRGLTDGQADGSERAFTEAMKKFQAQTADLQQMLKQSILQLDAARHEILQQARNDLLELAITIAEKVTHVAARHDVEVAKASLAKAIEMVGCRSQVVAKVCPAQLDQLQEYAAQFLAEMNMSDVVKFVADESMTPGDVMLASRNGEVDARVQTQLSNIVGALTGQTEESA